ncbi:MAG: hypothetical protein WDA20_09640 [Desulfuromonadales bacterium]
MDLSSLLQNLQSERVMAYIEQLDVQQLVENPVLLGAIGVLALVSLIMRWRLLLVAVMSVTGFVWLIHYVQQQGTELTGLGSNNLLLFVGGGVALIALVIYYLFVKAE